MKLPNSISDFGEIRRSGYYYADRTWAISKLEDDRSFRYALFLRPRRFGKSTLLSMLEHYYDIARKDEFDALFSGLHIGKNPTPEHNRYLILKLDFSGVGLGNGVDAMLMDVFCGLRLRIDEFFVKYQSLLAGQDTLFARYADQAHSPGQIIGFFLEFMRRFPYPMYILVDEYDKLVNDLIARDDHEAYKKVLEASTALRLIYERIKIATDGLVKRVFMTGISPVMLNDMASGFNIATNISLLAPYHDFCGFSQREVDYLVTEILAQGDYSPSLSKEQILKDIKRYYNGYRFARQSPRQLYNPSAVLSFLSKLSPPDHYPRELIDGNLRTDHQKLYTLLFNKDHEVRIHPMEIIRSLLTDGSISGRLYELFPLKHAYDEQFFASYLYYLGLTTIVGEDLDQLRMAIPNLTIQGIHGAILSYILEEAIGIKLGVDQLHRCITAMADKGDLGPFLALLDEQVLQKLSNRDLIRLDERGLKMLMLAYLSQSDVYLPFSELEIHRGYSDLILIPNRRFAARYGFVVELKYIKDEGRSEAALRDQVEACFVEAEAQLQDYLKDPRHAALQGPMGFVAHSVVQIGTRALLYRRLSEGTQTLRWDPRRKQRKAPTKKKPAPRRKKG